MAIDAAEAQERSAGGSSGFKSQAETFRRDERFASATSSLSAALERLNSPEMLRKVLRSAAHAGSKVIYEELQRTMPVEKGVLKESLFRWHDDKKSGPVVQRYLVGPNKREAGHWANVEFGHWRYNKKMGGRWLKSKKIDPSKTTSVKGVRHGGPGALDTPVWVPPNPYLRPAWEAKKGIVAKVMRKRASERIRELMAGKE